MLSLVIHAGFVKLHKRSLCKLKAHNDANYLFLCNSRYTFKTACARKLSMYIYLYRSILPLIPIIKLYLYKKKKNIYM